MTLYSSVRLSVRGWLLPYLGQTRTTESSNSGRKKRSLFHLLLLVVQFQLHKPCCSFSLLLLHTKLVVVSLPLSFARRRRLSFGDRLWIALINQRLSSLFNLLHNPRRWIPVPQIM